MKERKISICCCYNHCNFGFPLLSGRAKLIADANRIWTNDERAKGHIKEAMVYSEPLEKGDTFVYFYDMAEDENGKVTVRLVNESEGFGVYIQYAKEALPCFTQWKNTSMQDYVTGLEPGTGLPIGRSANLKGNTYKRVANR